MREIKFRAFDEENKKWVYGYLAKLIDGIRKYIAIIQEESDGLVRYYIHDGKSIGQYTGLKDKNGKEIYENDLIIGNTSFEDYNDEFEWTREKPCVVGWYKTGFWPFILEMRRRCDVVDIEVIGNIFENPELIKDSE